MQGGLGFASSVRVVVVWVLGVGTGSSRGVGPDVSGSRVGGIRGEMSAAWRAGFQARYGG